MAFIDPNQPVLPIGSTITASTGERYTVEALLGAGGQGQVFRVRSGNEVLALKWYLVDNYLSKINADEFYRNLETNVENGVPRQISGDQADQFIWPLKLVPRQNRSFGYLMKLFPEGYESMSHVLLGWKKDRKTGEKTPIHWRSYQVMIRAALNIVRAFEILHSQGLSYQDINEGGISINVNTGDVFICDCDNVAPDQTNLGIRGVMNYMAPEVLRNEKLPDRHTDEYSLAIILFRLFMYNHPMEGLRSVALRSDESITRREADERIYGYDPHYCLDPSDNVNRPAPKHADVRQRCTQFPVPLMDAFQQVFTRGVNDPSARLTATEWRKVLVQVRDCLVFYDGKERFYYTAVRPALPPNARMLVYSSTRKTLCMPDKVLYPYHFDQWSADYLTPVGKVVPAPNGMLVLAYRNPAPITCINQGQSRVFNPGEVIPLLPGMVMKIGRMEIQVQ